MTSELAFPKPGKRRKRKNPLKTVRKSNPKLLKLIKTFNCAACGQAPGNKFNPVDPSHIRTRGSGGPDELFNVWPKCRKCHTDWGKSWARFLALHPGFEAILRRSGWTIVDEFGALRLRHPLLEDKSDG